MNISKVSEVSTPTEEEEEEEEVDLRSKVLMKLSWTAGAFC